MRDSFFRLLDLKIVQTRNRSHEFFFYYTYVYKYMYIFWNINFIYLEKTNSK